MIKFTKDSLGKLTFAASCLIGLLSASNTACHADEKVQSPPHAMDRLNFSLDATPDSGYSYSRSSATNKIIDAYVGVGFKSDEPGTGWFGALISTPHRISKWEDVILGNEPDMDQAASALHPFWYGAVRLHAQALDSNGQNHFDPSLYMWTAEGPEPNLLPYSLLNPTHEDNALRLPFVGTPDKYFHFDLGPVVGEQPTGLPKETLVTVNVTKGYSMFPADDLDHPIAFPDGNGPVLGPAKVKIRWHWIWEDAANTDDPTVFITPASTPITMGDKTTQKAAGALQVGDKIYIGGRLLRYTIIKIETLADGTIKFTVYIDPDDDLFTENGDLQQQIERIQEAYKEAIYTGAQGVKFGLEAYKAVAEFYAYGPFFELGGEILVRAGTKAVEMLQAAVEARQLAQRMRTVAESTQMLIVQVKQKLSLPNQNAEQVAELERTLRRLEDIADTCSEGAVELDRMATAGERIGHETQEAAAASGEGTIVDHNCFAGETPIYMGDGSMKAIKSIQVGDYVLSEDVRTGHIAPHKVIRTFVHNVDETLILNVTGGSPIETTAAHPFYTDKNVFLAAGQLPLGTSIVTRAGPFAKVLSLQKRKRHTHVYNFTVEEDHTYFAGSIGLLVHNANFAGTCGFENAPAGAPGTLAHKEARWEEYLQRKAAEGKPPLSEQQWSNVYDANMVNAARGNAKAEAYGNTLGWGRSQVTTYPGGEPRKLDWADADLKKGLEYKAYTSDPVSPSGRASSTRLIRDEVELDARLISEEGWDVRWVFEGKGPNGPLRRLLEQKQIPWKMKDDVNWVAPWLEAPLPSTW